MGWVVERPVRGGRTRFTAAYRDHTGRLRSAGTFDTKRAAERAANRQDDKLADGSWIDPAAGRITFQRYAEDVWLPSRHLEVTTRAGYRSYLRIHFVPFFGAMQLARIMPSTVQEWVNQAGQPRVVDGKKVKGLSPRSIAKYHVMLHSVIEVKSTTERDPETPFPISAGELLEAIRQRGKYVIYRVTDVRSATPGIYRIEDPIGAVLDGRATLEVKDAEMTMGRPEVAAQ